MAVGTLRNRGHLVRWREEKAQRLGTSRTPPTFTQGQGIVLSVEAEKKEIRVTLLAELSKRISQRQKNKHNFSLLCSSFSQESL